MNGLSLLTNNSVSKLIGVLSPEVASYRWIVSARQYAGFLWPEAWFDELPPEVESRIEWVNGTHYGVGTDFLLEFGHLMSHDWIDVYAFAGPVDLNAWWTSVTSYDQRSFVTCYPRYPDVAATVDLYLKNPDAAGWYAFSNHKRLLRSLRAAYPTAKDQTLASMFC